MSSALRLGVVLLLLSAAVVCAKNLESKDITTNNEVKKETDKYTTTTNNNNEVKNEAYVEYTTTNNNNELKNEAYVDTTTNDDNNGVKKEVDDATTNNNNYEFKKEADQEAEEKRQAMFMGNPYFNQNYFSPWSFMNGMYTGYGYQNGLASPYMYGMYPGYGYQNGLLSPYMYGMYPGYGYQNGLLYPSSMNAAFPGYPVPANGTYPWGFFNGGWAGAYPMYPYSPAYLANPMMYSGYPFVGGYPGYPMQGMFPGYPGYGYLNGLVSPYMNGTYPGYGYQNGLASPYMYGMYPGYGYQNGLFSPYMNGMYQGYGYQNGLLSPYMNGMYQGYGYQNGLLSPYMNGMYQGYGYQNGLLSPYMNGMYQGYGYQNGLLSPYMNGMYQGYGYQNGLLSPYMNGMYQGYGYQNGLLSPYMNGMYQGYGYQNGLLSPYMNGMYPGYGYQNGLLSPYMYGMYPGYGYQNGLLYPSSMNAAFPGYPVPANGTYPWGFNGGWAGAYPMYPYSPAYLANPMMYSAYPFAGSGFGMQSWYGGMGLSAFQSPVGGMGSLFYPQPGYVGWNYPHWHQINASKESPLLKAIYNLGGGSTAPQRPSEEELKKLLSEHPWTREMLFNNTDDEIVKALREAKSLDELKKKLRLSEDKVNNLRTVFKAVKEDNVKVIIELGEKEDHWQDFKKPSKPSWTVNSRSS